MTAIDARWYAKVEQRRDILSVVTTHVSFLVLADGKVKNIKIISNTANQVVANTSIDAIVGAKLPAIPQEILKQIKQDWIDFEIPFTVFAR